MDRVEAETTVRRLVGDHVAPLIVGDLDTALDRARTPDVSGHAPTDLGWLPSYDPYWAAAEAVTMLATRTLGNQEVTRFTAEGATFDLTPPRLWELAAQLRSQSSIASYAETGPLGVIEIDTSTGYTPRSGGWPRTTRPDLDWS